MTADRKKRPMSKDPMLLARAVVCYLNADARWDNDDTRERELNAFLGVFHTEMSEEHRFNLMQARTRQNTRPA